MGLKGTTGKNVNRGDDCQVAYLYTFPKRNWKLKRKEESVGDNSVNDGESGIPSSSGMKGDNDKECKTGVGPPSPSGVTGGLDRKISQDY